MKSRPRLYSVIACVLSLVLVGTMVLAFSSCRNPWAGEQWQAEPDYLSTIEHDYQVLTRGLSDSFLTSVTNVRLVSDYAALSVKLYQATGKKRYLENARSAFNDVVGASTAMPLDTERNPKLKAALADFFNLEPLLLTYRELKARGMVSAKQATYVEYYADQFALYGLDRRLIADHNQILSRISGVALALQLFPHNPDRARWQTYINRVWDYWWPQRDLNEDAGTYNAIGLYELIQFATFQGKYDALKDRGVGRMFARYRDQLSPMGAMAQYGDDYFGNAWPIWAYDYEVAARLYNDPTYRGAAVRDFWFGLHNNPAVATTPFGNLSTLVEYYYMGQVLALKSTSLPALETATHSEISTRNVPPPGRANTPDMLILAPSRAPDAPFVMVELYAQGFHAQLNRRGAIQFYGADGIPFYHGLNRHNNSVVDGNITPLLPPGEPFPRPIANDPPVGWLGPPDTWNTESIDTRALRPISASGADRVEIDKLTLRLALPPGVSGATVIIDNVRLIGPAGTKRLDDFESLKNWQRPDHPYALTHDARWGGSALAVRLAAGASNFYTSKPFHLTFSTRDYTTIKYDWKYLYPRPLGLSFIFRITQPHGDVDSKPGDVAFIPTIEQTVVADRGEDAYGQITMSSYFTSDTTMVRRLVLTKEGVLIIQDTVRPGASANGYNAGPLWQFYTLAQHGVNWFDSAGEGHPWYRGDAAGSKVPNKSLLVYFSPAAGRTFGSVRGPAVTATPYVARTLYAKQTVKAGTPVSFVTVVVPHDTSQSAASVAGNINVRETDRGTDVMVGRTLHAWLGSSENWLVTHQA